MSDNDFGKDYHWWIYEWGWKGPSITIQFKPISWQLSFGWGGKNFCLGIGPIAIRLFWGVKGMFNKIAEKPFDRPIRRQDELDRERGEGE